MWLVPELVCRFLGGPPLTQRLNDHASSMPVTTPTKWLWSAAPASRSSSTVSSSIELDGRLAFSTL